MKVVCVSVLHCPLTALSSATACVLHSFFWTGTSFLIVPVNSHPLKLIRKHAATISCRDTETVLIRLVTDSNVSSSISINPHPVSACSPLIWPCNWW